MAFFRSPKQSFKLPRTQTSHFFDENVHAKEGRKETTGETAVCTLPMVPCGSSPVTRFALASAKNEAPEEEAVIVSGCFIRHLF